MVHSEKLEETILWKTYQEKITSGSKRGTWVKEIYETSAKYLLDVRQTFKNFTLHDETHILNVMDAIGGLLGEQIECLTIGEIELLILAACMHDLGMVYTDEEKQQCYEDEIAYKKFIRAYYSELQGCPPEDWPENTCQWYLRTLHPFRLPEVLQNEVWKELFERCPLEVVPKRCILAVCQAHGENPKELLDNRDLEYLAANDAAPLFCALLLRLGDLLDFDDTRAPKVLYSYVTCNDKSRAEWDKHQASAGFRYPDSPSTNELPYKARCTNPGVEHAIRDFLNWIDVELGNCIKLKQYCKASWQREFSFPRAVSRDEIESDGYMSGDFCLTMDQEQILKLLTGENLYDNADVFVRELLQNAIDATLLRGEMDSNFIPEESRIDLWEWHDKEGNIWFRIDDQGTGMTLGMLQRYFLKVGNSYYMSQELERDLRDHGQTRTYCGNSRFGIGFLSSFLCGDYVEVSTLYFDSEKNRREESLAESYRTVHYGLRLQVTGLTGYYTLKNQAKQHQTEGQLMAPDFYDAGKKNGIERYGYRSKPGTSVVIRLNPGKLGALDLRKTVEKYLCGARVPVYYNNKRIGRTYGELMQKVHEVAGERIYELTPELKKQFDDCFPAICGNYPKVVVTVIPLDTEVNCVLPELSGVLVKYDVRFDKVPIWEVKGQKYKVTGLFNLDQNGVSIGLITSNNSTGIRYLGEWDDIEKKYGSEETAALEEALKKCAACPQTGEQLGEAWIPFEEQMDIQTVWKSYWDNQQSARISFFVTECGCPNIYEMSLNNQSEKIVCAYQGIVSGDVAGAYYGFNNNAIAMFLLGGRWRPTVEISRSRILGLPLKVLVTICGILGKYLMSNTRESFWFDFDDWEDSSLREWREARDFQLDKWMNENLEDFFTERKQDLQKALNPIVQDGYSINSLSVNEPKRILYKYLIADFQDNYQMTINYEEGQIISFYNKKEDENEEIFDIFPPMMFCKAASERSRQYICSAEASIRRGITTDHPFIIWLLKNAVNLNQYYQRQFRQIIDCLCKHDAENVIQNCNRIREQLLALPEHHGVEVSAFPLLSMDDFWQMNEEKGERGLVRKTSK